MAQERPRRGKPFVKKEKPEFDQRILDLARVTRVTKGGKQMNFRACVIIGDRRGRVGYGLDKASDVQMAVEKAVNQAKKNLIRVPMKNETIPHRVEAKYKAARVMIKPAPRGSGIIAGGATRVILELAGVPNASAKMLGKTNNKVTNTRATFAALSMFLRSSYTAYSATPKAQPQVVAAPVMNESENKEEVTQAAPKAQAPKKAAPRAKKVEKETKAE